MINLKTSSISHVPLQKYDKDFTFYVNGKSFKTNRIIADLLSPKICKIHFNDSTLNEYTINTVQNGNFSYFLDLANFTPNNIPINEIPFIQEIVNILENDSIEFSTKSDAKITIDNVFELIQQHELNDFFFSKEIQEEIDFISSHFAEFNENQEINLGKLKMATLEKILTNPKLQLISEDQLLELINRLYINDSTYSILYEKVEFFNVSGKAIKNFLNIFDINDMTNEMWRMLSIRLEQEIVKSATSNIINRYDGLDIPFKKNEEFNGIINFLRNNSKASIYDIINISASSSNNSQYGNPRNSILFEDLSKDFRAINSGDVWICFDFKSHRISPTNYTIRSYNFEKDFPHPRSWVVEGSNDNNQWIIIDEQNDCNYLNGRNLVHTFPIKSSISEKFQYIRLRQTGLNWENSRQFSFNSIEFYGKLY